MSDNLSHRFYVYAYRTVRGNIRYIIQLNVDSIVVDTIRDNISFNVSFNVGKNIWEVVNRRVKFDVLRNVRETSTYNKNLNQVYDKVSI